MPITAPATPTDALDPDALAKLEQRIGPAARSPRAYEQFPYRPRPGYEEVDTQAIRAEANEIITGIENMVHKIVRDLVQCSNLADIDDIKQELLTRLWTYSLSRYDAHRGAKLSTYLYECLKWHACYFRKQSRRRAIRKSKFQPLDDTPAADAAIAPDVMFDDRVEQIAADVLAHPERYSDRPYQAIALQAYLGTGPDREYRETAIALGYRTGAGLTSAVFVPRENIASVRIEEWEPAQDNSSRRPREIYARHLGFPLVTISATLDRLRPHLAPSMMTMVDAIMANPDRPPTQLAAYLNISSNCLNRRLRLVGQFIERSLTQQCPEGSERRPVVHRLGLPADFGREDAEMLREHVSPRQFELLVAALQSQSSTLKTIATTIGMTQGAAYQHCRTLRKRIAKWRNGEVTPATANHQAKSLHG